MPVRWVCNSRVDTVDLKQFKLFKKAGCWMIGFGIESGSDDILSLMRKGITVAQVKKAVLMAKEAGLEVTGHIILGFPGETEATIKKTVKLAIDLDLDFVQFYAAVPFPGSELYTEAKSKGYINSHDWSYFEQNFSIMDLPNLPAKKIDALRSSAYRKFYLRPRVILKTLSRIRSPQELLSFLKMTNSFLKWI